jgi:adenylate cyclase class 2
MADSDEQLEIEMKFPVGDFKELEQRLRQHGAARRLIQPRKETDHYFNAPDRDFAQTDEALRLRRIGAANFLTYKGPKRDSQTKTRQEIEVPLARGEAAADDIRQLLRSLGYRETAVVRKRRRLFHWSSPRKFEVEICLDDVEDVGRYVELEIVAPASQLESARADLQQLAADLGLADSERRSYLEMLLDKKKGAV